MWGKCNYIFGYKLALLSSLLLFVAFSGGCGAAQSMDQLSVHHSHVLRSEDTR